MSPPQVVSILVLRDHLFLFFFGGVQYKVKGSVECWLLFTDKLCDPRCVKNPKHYYCYFSSCKEPELVNSKLSVEVFKDHHSKQSKEKFRVMCNEGYIVPFEERTSVVTNCDKKGITDSVMIDCIPKGDKDVIFNIGSTNFKCKDAARIASAHPVYVNDHIADAKTCFDKCAHDSKCR